MIALSDATSVFYSTLTIRLEEPIAIVGSWGDFGEVFVEEQVPRRHERPKKKRDPDYAARLERICDILARGAARLLAKERRERESAVRKTMVEPAEFTQEEEKVLRLVERFGAISPAELGEHLELSRASVARRTTALKQKGLLRSDGNTSALKFYLTSAGMDAIL